MAVKFRRAQIQKTWNEQLHKYITGIVQNSGHKMLAINSVPDHLHFFFGFRPSQSLSDLMQLVKGESSEWLNDNRICSSKFHWQTGYGAFSYSKSQIPIIVDYIQRQEEHHKKKTFLEEYKEILNEFGIEYDERYIFKPLE